MIIGCYVAIILGLLMTFVMPNSAEARENLDEAGRKKIRIIGWAMILIAVFFGIISYCALPLSDKYDEHYKEEIPAYNISFEDTSSERRVYYTDPATKEVKWLKLDSDDVLLDSNEEKIVKEYTEGFWFKFYDYFHNFVDTEKYTIYLKR